MSNFKSTLKTFNSWILIAAACTLLAIFGYPNLNFYYQDIFLAAGINVILAVSLTLVNGFTGQFSLGHAGFMAVGAYWSTALSLFLLPTLGLNDFNAQLFWFGNMITGGIMAGFFGWVVGLPSLRLKGDYLAIVTLGFGEIIRVALLNTNSLGGPRGMTGIPPLANQYWIIGFCFITTFCVFRLVGTPAGRAMFSVREDEVAAEAMGIDTTKTKVRAFVIGSFFAGIAGALYAHKYCNINPAAFSYMKGFEVVVIIVLGGLGSVSGAILAAIGLTILPEALRPLQEITGLDFRMIIYSLVLILFMLLRPNGILGRKEIYELFPRRGK